MANLNLRTKSGATYSFGIYSLNTTFKPLGSLYCISRENPDGKHTVLYIGQTNDLSARFNDHHKEDAWKRQGATHISVHLDESKNSRLLKEAALVEFYNPCCNG